MSIISEEAPSVKALIGLQRSSSRVCAGRGLRRCASLGFIRIITWSKYTKIGTGTERVSGKMTRGTWE
jgi:hypothetical protein